jgi:hypothetical protein
MRRAYLAADHAAGQLLWLPTQSSLGRLRPRPGYVAFMEVRADGKRPQLARATVIDPAWLIEACAPALTRLSPPRLELAPRYDAAKDVTLAWYTPTYGKAGWTLPVVPRPPPRSPGWLPSALFGRALCAGHVLKPLAALAPEFETRLRSLTLKTTTDRAVLALRAALEAQQIESCQALARAWSMEPKFLLRELAALLSEAKRPLLVELWPRLLVGAERIAGTRTEGKMEEGTAPRNKKRQRGLPGGAYG